MTLKTDFFTRSAVLLLFSSFLFFSCSSEQESESKNDGYVQSDSGIKYKFLKHGIGPIAEAGKEITVNITLKIGDSTEIWSANQSNSPFIFIYKVDPMIRGFNEVIGYTKEGDHIQALIPAELGYGAKGSGADIPPNALLAFDIEIVQVQNPRIKTSDVLLERIQTRGMEAGLTLLDSIKLVDENQEIFNSSEVQFHFLLAQLESDSSIHYLETIALLETVKSNFPKSASLHHYEFEIAKNYLENGALDLAKVSLENTLKINKEYSPAVKKLDSLNALNF